MGCSRLIDEIWTHIKRALGLQEVKKCTCTVCTIHIRPCIADIKKSRKQCNLDNIQANGDRLLKFFIRQRQEIVTYLYFTVLAGCTYMYGTSQKILKSFQMSIMFNYACWTAGAISSIFAISQNLPRSIIVTFYDGEI